MANKSTANGSLGGAVAAGEAGATDGGDAAGAGEVAEAKTKRASDDGGSAPPVRVWKEAPPSVSLTPATKRSNFFGESVAIGQ